MYVVGSSKRRKAMPVEKVLLCDVFIFHSKTYNLSLTQSAEPSGLEPEP